MAEEKLDQIIFIYRCIVPFAKKPVVPVIKMVFPLKNSGFLSDSISRKVLFFWVKNEV